MDEAVTIAPWSLKQVITGIKHGKIMMSDGEVNEFNQKRFPDIEEERKKKKLKQGRNSAL